MNCWCRLVAVLVVVYLHVSLLQVDAYRPSPCYRRGRLIRPHKTSCLTKDRQIGDCLTYSACSARHPDWRVNLLAPCLTRKFPTRRPPIRHLTRDRCGNRRVVRATPTLCCPRKIKTAQNLRPLAGRPQSCLSKTRVSGFRRLQSMLQSRPVRNKYVLKPAISQAVSASRQRVDAQAAREKKLIQTGRFVKKGTSAAKHQKQLAQSARINEENRETLVALGTSNSLTSSVASQCVMPCTGPPACDASTTSSPYRTADGHCNNLINPRKGQSFTAMWRLGGEVPQCGPNNSPRTEGLNNPLPNVREVSVKIMNTMSQPSADHTVALMQWGQFIDHDLVQTTGTTGYNGSNSQCCPQQCPATMSCFPITIPAGDPWFNSPGCMEFRRSAFAGPRDCGATLYRRTGNALTHFIDASNVYGSTASQATDLRAGDGLLKTNLIHNNFLPADASECNTTQAQQTCFKAGDSRVNEQPYLTVIHTLFVREHNRIAGLFINKYPLWHRTKIYQETRRIIGAIMQHITYKEFLPIVIGKEFMELVNMDIGTGYTPVTYDETAEPSILNSFSTAAFRFGHSLIRSHIRKSDDNCMSVSSSLLHQNNQPYTLYGTSAIPRLAHSYACDASEKMDNHFSDEVINRLFETTAASRDGLDLVALNIQRGRDHCLPSYNRIRGTLQLAQWTSFAQWRPHTIFSQPSSTAIFNQLVSLYHDEINDVDLYVGGLLEKPMIPTPPNIENYNTPLVGPTFLRIIGEQFYRLKRGDRFWYENSGQAGSFTLAQLADIKKVSLAQILCLHTNNQIPIPIPMIQKQIMEKASSTSTGANPKLSCSTIASEKITLDNW